MNRKNFVEKILYWYKKNKRDLPWRKTKEPYPIWLSEIMLQQTQVTTALPYYENFLNKFPNVESLATAPLRKILKSWEGLGYYSRARHLHSTAKEIKTNYGGKFPRNYERLIELPGIGPYTASAIASIAFGEPTPVVDGNVWRVFSRVLALPDLPGEGKKKVETFLKSIIPKSDPGDFNQAIMELGALVCTPKNPDCQTCPVNSFCLAYQQKQVEHFPKKTKQKILPHKNWMTIIFLHQDEILLRQRAETGLWGGLWEFPTIEGMNDGILLGREEKMDDILAWHVRGIHGKSLLGSEGKLPRAIMSPRRSTGDKRANLSEGQFTRTKPIQVLNPIQHTFSHFKLTLHPVLVHLKEKIELENSRWVNLHKNPYPLPVPHLKILQAIVILRKLNSFNATRAS